ncbi:MAG: beta-galactosidase [Planctomycetaceae bacterium]|nr:beta-galactosidase [Planctomycetaceae bacterium]
MAELRFRFTSGIVPESFLRTGYFASWGRQPRPTEMMIEGNELVVHSDSSSSGTVHVLWTNSHLGMVMESTESLPFQSRTYILTKELVRGSLGRLLRRVFEWQMTGFRPTASFAARTTAVSRRFSKIAVGNYDLEYIDKELMQILAELSDLTIDIAKSYTEQSLTWRLRSTEKLPITLGIGLHSHPINSLYEFDLYASYLREAFHAVLPMPTWREIEPQQDIFRWEVLEEKLAIAARYNFQIVMGPLLCFDANAIPAWLAPQLQNEDFWEKRAIKFVHAIVERFGAQVHSWILASRFNSCNIPSIPALRAINLVRHLAQRMRMIGVDKTIIVSIDRPWSEYSMDYVTGLDQIQLAEVLMNCSEIDAVMMEMNFGFDNRSTFPRDPVTIGNMIDQWGFLGKKIYASITVPSTSAGDPLDNDKTSIRQWSENMQQYWLNLLLRTLLGRRVVQGIFWGVLQDINDDCEDTKVIEPYEIPYAGLIDSNRILKPAFQNFIEVKKYVE